MTLSLYRLAWPLLRQTDPETAHRLAIRTLSMPFFQREPAPDAALLHTRVWNRDFPNPVGLAAGLDKDGEVAPAFLGMGFGFVEVGTVTPRPQPGNPRPRLFRLEKDQAIINRMGFNNLGAGAMAERFQTRRPKGILGINLGKNKETIDGAADYEHGIRVLAPYADYLVINVSSPNTPGLRDLQGRAPLEALLRRARVALDGLKLDVPPPLLVKIAPDLDDRALDDVIGAIQGHEDNAPYADGIICTNTLLARPPTLASANRTQAGGLSGTPLKTRATEILRAVYKRTNGQIPLIGVGGISDGKDAYERIRDGASLVQIYTALVYEGPGLVSRIKADLAHCLKADGFQHISQAVGVDAKGPLG